MKEKTFTPLDFTRATARRWEPTMSKWKPVNDLLAALLCIGAVLICVTIHFFDADDNVRVCRREVG